MWCFARTPKDIKLWFSDGSPIDSPKGGRGTSVRLIAADTGFLDVTTISDSVFDFNGSLLYISTATEPHIPLFLEISDSKFTVGVYNANNSEKWDTPKNSVQGLFKPLPIINPSDAEFLNVMMRKKYVPYQNIPESPGKTTEQIRKLGEQLFPFTPYSFQLAMSVYDWTTASFARSVLFKIYQYTGIKRDPCPLDIESIAKMIFASNWKTYRPSDPDYMNSFMMKPAFKLEDVVKQLHQVCDQVYRCSEVENRLFAAAVQSLPRTSVLQRHNLYSGQPDILQLGLEGFGIEFLQCPANNGPAGTPMVYEFDEMLETFAAEGKSITTKMVWSFTDSVKSALKYSNGILLVAQPPPFAVWESVADITGLSDDPDKIEYTFVPGTTFKVISITRTKFEDKDIIVINLMPEESSDSQRLAAGPALTMSKESPKTPTKSIQDIKTEVLVTEEELESQVSSRSSVSLSRGYYAERKTSRLGCARGKLCTIL